MWLEFSFMEGTDRSGAPPASAAVGNEWNYDCALSISLLDVDRDTFTHRQGLCYSNRNQNHIHQVFCLVNKNTEF